MMENTPLKFRLLEYIEANPDQWNDQIVPQIQSEYNMNSDHGRNMINYDLIELVSAGLIREEETKIDEDGHYKKDALLTQYAITNLGRSYLDDLRVKVIPKGA